MKKVSISKLLAILGVPEDICEQTSAQINQYILTAISINACECKAEWCLKESNVTIDVSKQEFRINQASLSVVQSKNDAELRIYTEIDTATYELGNLRFQVDLEGEKWFESVRSQLLQQIPNARERKLKDLS